MINDRLSSKSTLTKLIDALLFPARVVHCVTYFFWFLQKEGTHGGSTGFSGIVLACSINILLHLVFAMFGISYWEFCASLSGLFGSPVAFIPYLFINIGIGIWLSMRFLRTDECIAKMKFIYSTRQRKVVSLVGFCILVPGFVILNYQVAMWTLVPW